MPTLLIDAMSAAASRFLDSLDPDQRERATRRFENEAERTEWYYTPNARPGIPMMELDARQQQHVRRLLRSGLSEGGYNVAATIMGLEAILDPVENWAQWQYLGYDRKRPSINRDPNMYFVCVFGEPGSERWGWSFGGHHVSVHHTIVDGQLATTPCFFGSHPAVSPLQPGFFLEPLAAERKLGLELYHALDSDQRRVATLSPVAPHDTMMVNRPYVVEDAVALPPWIVMGTKAMPESQYPARITRFEEEFAHVLRSDEQLEPMRYTSSPTGLPASAMTDGQRDGLRELVGIYLHRLPDEVAEGQLARVQSEFGSLAFAWAGGDNGQIAHYYRIQGPTLLIEYDSPFDDGCHIHAVWRDAAADFGKNLLGAHYAEAHR
ncbi:MAG: DUF3500 domain-containing protein [bacterium]